MGRCDMIKMAIERKERIIMSGLFGIIWIIVVICSYGIYKQRMWNSPENNQRGQIPNQRDLVQTFQGQRPMQAKPIMQMTRAKQMPQAEAQKSQPAERQNKNEPESTLAYLEEKARQDAIEHEMGKRKEARRFYESSGGLRPAGRLYEGDSVPNGCKCVSCGYCGAPNLISMGTGERFSCYFCREPLDT